MSMPDAIKKSDSRKFNHELVVMHPKILRARVTSVSSDDHPEGAAFQLGIFLTEQREHIILAGHLRLVEGGSECVTTASGAVYGITRDKASAMDEEELGALFKTTAAATVLYHSAAASIRQLAAIIEMNTEGLPPLMPVPEVEVIQVPQDDDDNLSQDQD